MTTFFTSLSRGFDFLFIPVRNAAPVVGIMYMAFLTALLLLTLYRVVSHQEAIRAARKRIQGHFLGIYLFRNEFRLVCAAVGRVMCHSARYMGHSLRPLAVAVIPVALTGIQLQLRYGYDYPEPGDRIIVTVESEPVRTGMDSELNLSSSDEFQVEAGPVAVPSRNEVSWRLQVLREGEGVLSVSSGGRRVFDKRITIGKSVHRVYPWNSKGEWWQTVLLPGMEHIEEDSPVRVVALSCKPARVKWAGFELHWSVFYFVITLIFGILLKRFFGVQF